MARLRLDLGEDGSSVKWYGGRECVLVLCTRQGYGWGASRQMRIHLVWVCGVKWTGRMDVGLGQTGYAPHPRVRIGTEGHGQAITARLHFCLLFKSNKHATAL